MTLVPSTAAVGHYSLPNGDDMEFDDTKFHQILFGGDQLTVAWMRGTQALRDTQDKPIDRLEGVTPVVEDWHTRMTLMKVRAKMLMIDFPVLKPIHLPRSKFINPGTLRLYMPVVSRNA